jgi:hypothetical protein
MSPPINAVCATGMQEIHFAKPMAAIARFNNTAIQ